MSMEYCETQFSVVSNHESLLCIAFQMGWDSLLHETKARREHWKLTERGESMSATDQPTWWCCNVNWIVSNLNWFAFAFDIFVEFWCLFTALTFGIIGVRRAGFCTVWRKIYRFEFQNFHTPASKCVANLFIFKISSGESVYWWNCLFRISVSF